MCERILVPLDGSKVGESALPYVENVVSKLSPEVKVEVTLLRVLSPTGPSYDAGYVVLEVACSEKQMEEASKKAIDYLNKVGEALRSKGVAVAAKIAVGDVAEEIVKAAEEINVDLIVMSTHGRSGLSRWVFGSVTDKALRHKGKVPILMVKAPKKTEKAWLLEKLSRLYLAD